MRLISCARITVLSSAAVLLSGCSWFGYGGGQNSYQNNYQTQSARYKGSQTQYSVQNGRRALGRCQITAPTQRIPQGCRPEQVTLALGGPQAGYGQQAQYTSGAYGSHVGAAQTAQANYAPQPQEKRPRLRGQLSLGLDPSLSGTLIDPALSGTFGGYASSDYYPVDGTLISTPADGITYQINNFSSTPENISTSTISTGDVYTAPLQINAGLEFILNDHNTLFAQVGYTHAEGKKGGSSTIVETLSADVRVRTYNGQQALTSDNVNPTVNRGEVVAKTDYEFNEMTRFDLEVGGRHYLDAILPNMFERSITPFVSASAGASHYNETTQKQHLQQGRLANLLVGIDHEDGNYENLGVSAPTQIYDAQWVPYGALKGGLEWQMTPKTALAFEAGVKYEGARDFSNGTKGDDIISVPVTIRGSYNF